MISAPSVLEVLIRCRRNPNLNCAFEASFARLLQYAARWPESDQRRFAIFTGMVLRTNIIGAAALNALKVGSLISSCKPSTSSQASSQCSYAGFVSFSSFSFNDHYDLAKLSLCRSHEAPRHHSSAWPCHHTASVLPHLSSVACYRICTLLRLWPKAGSSVAGGYTCG
jgi:hypothetical protein